jgi:hypothetical protein
MKVWSTIIYAKCPIKKEIITFSGPFIEAPSPKLAFEYCQNNGMGYCHIGDECIEVGNLSTGEVTKFNEGQDN